MKLVDFFHLKYKMSLVDILLLVFCTVGNCLWQDVEKDQFLEGRIEGIID